MWLERLSGHSTPSSSPPPSKDRIHLPIRRSSHLAPPQRPCVTSRGSVSSLVSNDSATSLLSDTWKPTGSGLRQSTTVSDAPEALEVLEELLGSAIASEKEALVSTSGGDEADDVEKLNFHGLSLYELARFSTTFHSESAPFKTQTVEEYEKEKSALQELHRSIQACDDILGSVQTNLTSFQDDLGAVSTEVETLQARSTALNLRLTNRKVVEKGLSPFIEEIILSPATVKKISEGQVDEAWVKALSELEKRSKVLSTGSKESENVRGYHDLRPLLDNLINRALERIRDFLVAQIKSFRSPNINAQVIQHHLVRYRDLYAFLWRHNNQLAEEISQAYMNTMRWYYLSQFTRYQKSLEKVRLHVVDKHDLLGVEEGVRKTGGLLSSTKAQAPSHDAFNLGRRIDLLRNANAPAVPAYLAEEDATHHYIEFPFRHFNQALIDNASTEYAFLASFFTPSHSYPTISRNLNTIFEPTFALGTTLTRTLISETQDSHGILLCLRLNQHSGFELQRRKIPAVDGYINSTNMHLWPRFQMIIDAHCDSLRRLASTLPTKPPTNKTDLSRQSVVPHPLTQRFAHFLSGILQLSTKAADDEPVGTSIGRLRAEMEVVLGRLGKVIEGRKRERFLENNYAFVGTIIGDVDGALADEQREHFEGLTRAHAEAL